MDLLNIMRLTETVVVLIIVITGTVGMFRKEKRSIREWLLLAVTEAERAFGRGTGELKLRYVWEQACGVFPLLTRFIGFDAFAEMVDDRLTDLRHILETNSSLSDYIGALPDSGSSDTENGGEDE